MAPKPSRQHLRSKIQAIRESGKDIKAIAKELKVDRNTVRLWCRRGDGDVHEKDRSGRPTKMTPETKYKITKLTKETGRGI